jgi:hypothetical protein
MRPSWTLLAIVVVLGCRTVPAELPEPQPERAPPSAAAPVDDPRPRVASPGDFTPVSPEIEALYRCWFRNPYSYMFAYDGELLEYDGKRFGMLMAGTKGILYYGRLNTCAGELTGVAPRNYADVEPIAALAGVPATLPSSLPFAAVNPELIAFARQRLLPSPDQWIDHVETQRAYDLVFRRFFRVMTLSVMVLLESSDVDGETADYLAATSRGHDGIDWLENRYGGRIPELGGYADGTMMTAPMAAGFWLRRHADGSFAACWHGLREVLDRYDAVWLGEQQARHPKAAAELAQLHDPLLP